MENFLREYVRTVIAEDLYFRGFGTKSKKDKSFARKIKDKLGIDRAGAFAEDWIEDQEEEYDFEMPDKMKEKVHSFVNRKYRALYLKYEDKQKVESKLSASLRKVFGRYLYDVRMEREREERLELEDEKEDMFNAGRKDKRRQAELRDDD